MDSADKNPEESASEEPKTAQEAVSQPTTASQATASEDRDAREDISSPPEKTKEETACQQLKAARDFGATTTKIGLVLFAALIVSFAAMWDDVDKYRSALASQKWFTKHKQVADLADLTVVGQRVKWAVKREAFELTTPDRSEEEGGSPAVLIVPVPATNSAEGIVSHRCDQLANRYFPAKPDKPEDQRDQLLCMADETTRDPYQELEKLQKNKDWRAPSLAKVIEQEVAMLRGTREIALRRFHLKRAVAQRTAFKLLGLDFSVNGFWAWDVWCLLFTGGVVHLWLARRAIFRRCRLAWSVLSSPCSVVTETSPLKDSLPVWLRPLPDGEPWVQSTTNSLRIDIVMDPLSFLCLLLMWACLSIAIIAVVRLSVVSCALLNGPGSLGREAVFQAALCCLLSGVIFAAILDWYLPHGQKSARSVMEAEIRNDLVVVSRRAWILAALGSVGTMILYRDPANGWLLKSLLNKPRFNRAAGLRGPRKRRRKLVNVNLEEGFYQDSNGQIHYVPQNQRVRSLSGTRVEDLHRWAGPFDKSVIEEGLVHPSALIPFVRTGVVSLIRGYRHRKDAAKRAEFLASADVQRRYRDAFELTKAAVLGGRNVSAVEPIRRGGAKMPSVQLCELLAKIAINSNSADLLQSAKDLLNSAQLQRSETAPAISVVKPAGDRDQRPNHSRHSKRKAKRALALCRRAKRFDISARPISGYRLHTWTPSRHTAETANNVQVVRVRKHGHHRNRISRRTNVKCA